MPSTDSISFSRTLAKYNISTPYVLYVPRKISGAHLARHDNVILVDEREQEYSVVFVKDQDKFMRGWQDFSIAHRLQMGDKLSFNLIGQCKFKVHITRFTNNEVQKYVPVRLGKRKHQTAENTCSGNTVTKKSLVSRAVDRHQMTKDIMLCQIKKKVHAIERMVSKEKVYVKSRNRLTGTKVADGSSYVNFHDCPNIDEPTPLKVQSVVSEDSEFALRFEDFKIDVNGKSLDSEIPLAVRMKYYQLCCGQKKLIHDGVVKGIDSEFAVSVILEIARIADSVKAAKISTAPHVLEWMGKTLKFYHEDLGFAVGSLRAKIRRLTEFSSEHQDVEEKKQKLCFMFDKEARLTW